MSAPKSHFELLPNELLDEIISYLRTSPPSASCLQQPPSLNITRSHSKDLKNLSRVSSRFLKLVRPLLLAHVCFHTDDEDKFLQFLKRSNLTRYVLSVVAKRSDQIDGRGDPLFWQRVLQCLDPLRITVIAPPLFLGGTVGTKVTGGHSWAFQIPLQILQLEIDRRICDPTSLPDLRSHTSLLSARPWTSMLFNESSSLKAYNHYEYFLYKVPSALGKWGDMAAPKPRPVDLPLSLAVERLTSFHYTAVFPFYNHVKLVLNAVSLMTQLQLFRVQLAPGPGDKAIETEQRGSMDPSDPWMEIYTGYSLISHTVRDLWYAGCLRRFESCDYALDALQLEISPVLEDVLAVDGWAYEGHGVWTKKARRVPGMASEAVVSVDDANAA